VGGQGPQREPPGAGRYLSVVKTYAYSPKGLGHGRAPDPGTARERAEADAAVYKVTVDDGRAQRVVYVGADFNELCRRVEAADLSKAQLEQLLKAGTLAVP